MNIKLLLVGKTDEGSLQGLIDNYIKRLKIIVEARSFEEIRDIMEVGGVHRVLIDNFNFEDTKRAVQLINGKFQTESSGGITLETVGRYAETGVDFISSGALTHSVYNLDLSLKAY